VLAQQSVTSVHGSGESRSSSQVFGSPLLRSRRCRAAPQYCGPCGPTEAEFWAGAACKCDTRKALDFPTLRFGTRRSVVQIHSPRPIFSITLQRISGFTSTALWTILWAAQYNLIRSNRDWMQISLRWQEAGRRNSICDVQNSTHVPQFIQLF